ncbi:Gfo/Idh/MocA family oxidoreductase [candidate division KSB1 bacterium]|nr:Gfo/Idh/MocA family oxidoreductase [candidate division KSB1 bacterium]
MKTTRREFVKKSTATLVGMGIAGIGAKKVSANDKILIGLIGCRNMGFANLKWFLKNQEVECAALCDVDSEILTERSQEVAELSGKKPVLYKDFRKLLEDKDIDAVIVGTPDHWHCIPTVYACQVGKDVYVEKPMANTIQECDIMQKAAQKYGRIVQVGQQQRSAVHWADAIKFVKSGELGKIRRINVWANFNYAAGRKAVPDEPPPAHVDFDMWLGPAPKRTFNPARFHGYWRMFWDYGGGLLTDWGVHLIDMALWAMDVDGPPKSVSSAGGQFDCADNAIETAETQHVLYQFENFIMVWEHNGGIQTGPNRRNYGLAFVGTNGTLWADRDNWEVIPEEERMAAVEPHKTDGMSNEHHVKNFIHCLKTREKPNCDVNIGRNAAYYAHLGNIAYRTGQKLVWNNEKKYFDNPEAIEFIKTNYRAPWKLPEI